jgi:hypothetical protein
MGEDEREREREIIKRALFFYRILFLWNNEAVVPFLVPFCVTFDMRDSTSYAAPGPKMRDTFAMAKTSKKRGLDSEKILFSLLIDHMITKYIIAI